MQKQQLTTVVFKIAAFTDSSDETAAPSSDSALQNNNDWLTDDDDDNDDEDMDESPLNVQPAAKAAAKKPKSAPPLTPSKLLEITSLPGTELQRLTPKSTY